MTPPPSRKGAAAARVVAVLAGLLERAAERGDAEGAPASAFSGRARPGIAVRRYAERIYRYAGCSPACFVVAYVYLDRLAGRREDERENDHQVEAVVSVDSRSVHRLLITSVMVAAKFMDDIHYNNAYFARVGGVEVAEMNALELDLLFALRFRLNVTPDIFARYCAALEGEMVAATVEGAAPLLSPPPPEEEGEEEQAAHGLQDAAGTGAFAAAAQRALVVETAR